MPARRSNYAKMDADLLQFLKKDAKRLDIDMSELIKVALWDVLPRIQSARRITLGRLILEGGLKGQPK